MTMTVRRRTVTVSGPGARPPHDSVSPARRRAATPPARRRGPGALRATVGGSVTVTVARPGPPGPGRSPARGTSFKLHSILFSADRPAAGRPGGRVSSHEY